MGAWAMVCGSLSLSLSLSLSHLCFGSVTVGEVWVARLRLRICDEVGPPYMVDWVNVSGCQFEYWLGCCKFAWFIFVSQENFNFLREWEGSWSCYQTWIFFASISWGKKKLTIKDSNMNFFLVLGWFSCSNYMIVWFRILILFVSRETVKNKNEMAKIQKDPRWFGSIGNK